MTGPISTWCYVRRERPAAVAATPLGACASAASRTTTGRKRTGALWRVGAAAPVSQAVISPPPGDLGGARRCVARMGQFRSYSIHTKMTVLNNAPQHRLPPPPPGPASSAWRRRPALPPRPPSPSSGWSLPPAPPTRGAESSGQQHEYEDHHFPATPDAAFGVWCWRGQWAWHGLGVEQGPWTGDDAAVVVRVDWGGTLPLPLAGDEMEGRRSGALRRRVLERAPRLAGPPRPDIFHGRGQSTITIIRLPPPVPLGPGAHGLRLPLPLSPRRRHPLHRLQADRPPQRLEARPRRRHQALRLGRAEEGGVPRIAAVAPDGRLRLPAPALLRRLRPCRKSPCRKGRGGGGVVGGAPRAGCPRPPLPLPAVRALRALRAVLFGVCVSVCVASIGRRAPYAYSFIHSSIHPSTNAPTTPTHTQPRLGARILPIREIQAVGGALRGGLPGPRVGPACPPPLHPEDWPGRPGRAGGRGPPHERGAALGPRPLCRGE